jgi:hypothetical protein
MKMEELYKKDKKTKCMWIKAREVFLEDKKEWCRGIRNIYHIGLIHSKMSSSPNPLEEPKLNHFFFMPF